MPPKKLRLLLLLFITVVFWALIWSRLISINSKGVYLHHDFMWADWAAHLTMVSRMVHGSKLIPLQSPFMIGSPFSYPFAVNLISALLVKLGVPLFTSMTLVSFLSCTAGTILLFVFLKKLFRSATVGIVGTSLFYLNGGLGFLLSSPNKFTHHPPASLHLINVIESIFIPQRAFALGFPITLIILFLILNWVRQPARKFLWRYFGLGLLIGLISIIHTHSFLALFIILSSWSLGSWFLTPSSKRKNLLYFWVAIFIGSCLTAIPMIKFYFSQNLQVDFFQWYPGWYALEDRINWLWFWLLNWGVMPILGLAGYIILFKQTLIDKTARSLRWQAMFLAPFWLIFIMINLFKFQPNIWDNTKLWLYSSLGISSLAAYFLVKTWQLINKKTLKHYLLKSGLVLIFIVSILAGSHDVFQITQTQTRNYLMYSAEELSLAGWVRENTAPDSIWLTSDKHNHWLSNLTGRQSLMGYRGWLWTHGYQYQTLEREMQQMFQHPQQSSSLFQKYKVNYAVIDQYAIAEWRADQTAFGHFQLIKASENYQLYAF